MPRAHVLNDDGNAPSVDDLSYVEKLHTLISFDNVLEGNEEGRWRVNDLKYDDMMKMKDVLLRCSDFSLLARLIVAYVFNPKL